MWIITITFLSLLYYTSLEIMTSYAKGHSMRTVVTGLQSGVQFMDHFGRSRRKTILVFLPSQGLFTFEVLLTSTKPYMYILCLNCSLQMEHILNKHNLIYAQFSMKLLFILYLLNLVRIV